VLKTVARAPSVIARSSAEAPGGRQARAKDVRAGLDRPVIRNEQIGKGVGGTGLAADGGRSSGVDETGYRPMFLRCQYVPVWSRRILFEPRRGFDISPVAAPENRYDPVFFIKDKMIKEGVRR
jgi:hypothetical protein